MWPCLRNKIGVRSYTWFPSALAFSPAEIARPGTVVRKLPRRFSSPDVSWFYQGCVRCGPCLELRISRCNGSSNNVGKLKDLHVQYVLQTFTSLHPRATHWDVPTNTFYLWSTMVKWCDVIFQPCFKCPIKAVEPRLTLVVSHYACRRTSVMGVCLAGHVVYGGWFMSMNSTCRKWGKLGFPSGSTMISVDHFDCQWF